MAKRRWRASEYGFIDCPNCNEGDERNLGLNVCGLCECRFVVNSYSRKAVWTRRGGVLTRDVGGKSDGRIYAEISQRDTSPAEIGMLNKEIETAMTTCSCGGSPDQPAEDHDISCPLAISTGKRGSQWLRAAHRSISANG